MANIFLSSILSKTTQVLGFVQRLAVLPSSSSDPRSSILKDLKELEKTLKWIQAVLHDAEEREIREEAVRLWLQELKEVAYDAEDVLDEYQYEELRAQVEGRASRKRKRVKGDDEEEVSIPDDMGDRIREIRERFDEISLDREWLCLREGDGERRVFEAPYPAPTSHIVNESTIYGRERDKQEIIDLLFSEIVGNGISVIPIVGKGGLGKTTIAQLVYNDPKIKQYFHLTGWVCVSDDFDVRKLTKDIIDSLTPPSAKANTKSRTRSSCDLAQLSTLQETLKEKVKGKRVLLVLDDVWNEQESLWESLRNPFVVAKTAEIVRIIVTCRNDSAAEIMQTIRPYYPNCLSPEHSWSLFRHYAFDGRNPEEQPCLVNIGKQIVKKCSGLPLALKSIGSLLRYMADEESWIDVIQNDIWDVDENNEILPALRLSYNHMPAHLKRCFVYCSIFPKDHAFYKYEMVRLWMAQGYIPSGGGRMMEDIADEYFNDLQRRSFFDSSGHHFTMHDMIYDLAKSIAGNDKARHLYVEGKEGLLKSLHSYNLSALRTLLPRLGSLNQMVIPEINKYLPQLKCLRTLEFCWEREDEIPDLLGNLKHLRYLHIRAYNIKRLPESICLLYHLQILKLYCDALAELSDGLGNLTNLHFLEIANSGILFLPAGIGKLTNLQCLRGYYELQGGIGVLKDLVNLQEILRISGLKNLINIEDARDAGLKHMHKLTELILAWDSCSNAHYGLHVQVPKGNEDVPTNEKWEEDVLEYLQPHANLKKLCIEGYGGSKFPEWMGNPLSFASLQNICIIDCKRIRSLPLYIHYSLEKLGAPISKSMLERVYISGCLQLTSIKGLHNLHSLKELEIHSCPRLQFLLEEGLPSKLEELYIVECQQLTSLPKMQNLSSLKKLTIENCSRLQFLSEEGPPSNLIVQHIEKFQLLTSLPEMRNFASLEKLTIRNCPQLRLLSAEGLPSNLQDLYIKECLQLASLLGMQNITSLKKLTIQNCPQLRLSSKEGLPSKLEELHIEKCQELTLLPGMQNPTSLRVFTIQNCPQLQLLSEEGLPSNLQDLYINECQELTSLPGMQNLTSLRVFRTKNCPRLRLLSEEGLPSNLQDLYIEGCQQLTSLPRMQDLTSLIELYIINCPQLRFLSKEGLPSNLERLFIEECQQLTSLPEMQNLTSLNILSIENCPQLQFLSKEGLPSNLERLIIKECQQLTSLPKMQNLTSLNILSINNCPKLQIMAEDYLSSMPRSVEIVDCPGLSNWCLIQNLKYIQATS